MNAQELLELDEQNDRKAAAKTNGHDPKALMRYELPKELPDYWYQTPGNRWFVRDVSGVYKEYPTTHIRSLLLRNGVRGSVVEGERLSPVEVNLLALREQHTVHWCGELAGFAQGVHEVCGNKILVTKSPKFVKAEKGQWDTLKNYLGELLGDQLLHFYGWVKSALRSLYSGHPFRPGQALAVAGGAGCGKSLLQSVITEIFGGRAGRPFQFLMGETGFNEDLISCEHLMIEDEAASRDPRKRAHFGGQLKNLIANEIVRGHPKGAKAMYVHAFNRVSITLNSEPENMLVLPHIGDDLRDKLMLMQAWHATFPYGKDNLKKRREFRDRLSAELPGFLHFLGTWKIPKGMADQRYGVKAYQNPELMQMLQEDQPHFHLLELIDRLQIWDVDRNPWLGTASQLQDDLREKDKHGRVADLLSWPTACGQYLAKLCKQVPNRVRKAKTRNNLVLWEIVP